MDAAGVLTPTGEYYYSAIAQEAPRHALDYAQQPERRGNRTSVKLLDGRKAIVRSWDPVRSEWRYTKLGRDFYKDSVDRYVVTFPVKEMHIVDGEVVWEKDTVLKSTATSLGEVALPTLMPEAEQLAEVKRRADAFVAGLDEQDGWEGSKAFKIVDAYNITLLDTSRPLEYNREHVEVGAGVDERGAPPPAPREALELRLRRRVPAGLRGHARALRAKANGGPDERGGPGEGLRRDLRRALRRGPR